MSFISLPLRRILTIAMSSGLLLSVWTPARAEMSAWADNEGGRMRLIALPPDASGTIRAGLQIEPKPGWVTYWREPGNSGIPPQITFPPETGIALDRMEYPVPRHIADGKVDEVVYDAPVTLPLRLSVKNGAAGEIKADAFIGICKDICVPFQARFALKLSPVAQSRPQEEAILAAADARLPETPSSEFEVTKFALSEDMRELTLTITLPDRGDHARGHRHRPQRPRFHATTEQQARRNGAHHDHRHRQASYELRCCRQDLERTRHRRHAGDRNPACL